MKDIKAGSCMMVQVQCGAQTVHGSMLMTISEYTIKWFSEHVITSFKQLSHNFDSHFIIKYIHI